jgi:hypothetical protein
MWNDIYLSIFVRAWLAGLFGFLIGWERVATGSPGAGAHHRHGRPNLRGDYGDEHGDVRG